MIANLQVPTCCWLHSQKCEAKPRKISFLLIINFAFWRRRFVQAMLNLIKPKKTMVKCFDKAAITPSDTSFNFYRHSFCSNFNFKSRIFLTATEKRAQSMETPLLSKFFGIFSACMEESEAANNAEAAHTTLSNMNNNIANMHIVKKFVYSDFR